MPELADIERRVIRLDRRIRPVIEQPADDREPKEHLAQVPAGPLVDGEFLLRALLTHYADGDDDTRAAVRRILRDNRSFAWAAHVPWEPTTANCRLQVLYLSARDGGEDVRDEIVTLDDLCTKAGNAGIEIAPILREVAEISSDEDRYGMGSTRDLLLSRARRYAD